MEDNTINIVNAIDTLRFIIMLVFVLWLAVGVIAAIVSRYYTKHTYQR
jgi:capsular polysaccharide biosynthesis protein